MSLIASLFQAANTSRSPTSDFWYNPVGVDTSAGLRISSEASLKASAVWSCATLISEALGSMPLILYERLDDQRRERAVNYPLYPVLHDEPNRAQTTQQWVEMGTMQILLNGGSYSQIKASRDWPVGELLPLNPTRQRMTPELLPDWRRRYRYRKDDGSEHVYSDDEVLYVQGMSLDGIRGLSVIEYARESIGLSLAAEMYGARLFGHGTAFQGILKVKGKLSEKGGAQLASSFKQKHSSLANAWDVPVLEDGVDWQQVNMTSEDAQFLELRNFQVEDIARWFRVPQYLIGHMTKETSWGSGIEQLGIGFVIYTLLPWIKRWESSIKRTLITDTRRYFAEFLVDGLLRGDQKSRYEAYAIGKQWGFLNTNDINRLENRNPIEGPAGNTYWRPVNMTDANAPVRSEPVLAALGGSSQWRSHYQLIVGDLASRIIRKETTALGKAAQRFAADPDAWADAVREFYSDHAQFVAETLRIHRAPAESYVTQQREALLRDGAIVMADWESRRTTDLVALAMEEHDAATKAA